MSMFTYLNTQGRGRPAGDHVHHSVLEKPTTTATTTLKCAVQSHSPKKGGEKRATVQGRGTFTVVHTLLGRGCQAIATSESSEHSRSLRTTFFLMFFLNEYYSNLSVRILRDPLHREGISRTAK